MPDLVPQRAGISDGQTINQGNIGSRYKRPGYVRVSTVVNVLDKGEGMKHWYYKFKTFKDSQEALRVAAARGSAIDDIVKRICQGEGEFDIPQAYSKYMEAFFKWQNEWSFQLESADEEVFDDDLKYVGTLDLYGALTRRGVTQQVIIDVKTGDPSRNMDGSPKYAVYESSHYQTSAYRAAKAKQGAVVDGNWILRLFSDGNYRFEPDGDFRKSFEIFTHCLAICQLKSNATNQS